LLRCFDIKRQYCRGSLHGNLILAAKSEIALLARLNQYFPEGHRENDELISTLRHSLTKSAGNWPPVRPVASKK
jgi:hypothetical protein